MSYDVDLIEIKHSSNYTSNVCQMLNVATEKLNDEGKIQSYTYWVDAVCDYTFGKENLRQIIKELKSNPDKYKKYNPENGWGNYKTCIEWLQEIYLNWKDGYEIRIDK